MSFADAAAEARERFSEALQLLNVLDAAEQDRAGPASSTDKAFKGLALVSIYAAIERSVNYTVEQAIQEISSHSSPSASCRPSVIAIFNYRKIQAVKDCGGENTLARASELISSATSQAPALADINPFLMHLQNVGADTLSNVVLLFGISNYLIPIPSAGRLNNLRERRNAISHGRESAAAVGERFTMQELRMVYSIADAEISRFIEALRVHCEAREYLAARGAA